MSSNPINDWYDGLNSCGFYMRWIDGYDK